MTHPQFLELAVSLGVQVAFVVAVSVFAARRVKSAHARDIVWSCCLIALALLPPADLLLPHLRLLPVRLPQTGEPATSSASRTMVAQGLLWVWLAGAAFFTSRLLWDIARLGRLFRTAIPAPASFVEAILNRIAPDAARASLFRVGRRRVGILFSDSLPSPACWQLHRPLIVLPRSVEAFSLDETELIIRHELAHLHSRHPLLLFVQRIVEIVFWIHPAAWWGARQAERAREFHCDQVAVTTRASATCYLRTILRLTSLDAPTSAVSGAALGFGTKLPLIVERAQRLASHDWNAPPARERTWRMAAPLASAGLAMLLLWVPLGPTASRRSVWSPWPTWSAAVLRTIGVPARDYEVDGYRLSPYELQRVRPK